MSDDKLVTAMSVTDALLKDADEIYQDVGWLTLYGILVPCVVMRKKVIHGV